MSQQRPAAASEGFTRNSGSVGRRKIVFVGASYLFVHRVLRDMLLAGGFEDCRIVVHDIDPEPMNVVGDLLERIARQKKTNIEVSRTLDRAEALDGADLVVLSITVGGRESDQRSFEVCAKYGVPAGIGDTMGPMALARNLRTVPECVAIARDMEKHCPHAVLLNFTNPMSALTGAVNRYTAIPCWGLCHSADALYEYFARIFNAPKSQVKLNIGGVNHQAFVSGLWIDGNDRTGEILAASQASDATLADEVMDKEEEAALQQDLYRVLGAWPSTGGTHAAEFYRWFFTPRRIDEKNLREDRWKIIPGRGPMPRKTCPEIIHQWAYGPEPVGDLHLMTNEHAHELMWAALTGEPFTRVLNVMNDVDGRPLIEGLPSDACVEALVTVNGKEVTGETIQLPTVITALLHTWTSIHDLSICAAMECDRKLAAQALALDPHVSDLYDIEPMVEDFVIALKPWLGDGWTK